MAYATREGDHITVHDIRNFEYRSAVDFTPRYETREYDLANLHGLDLFINYWGSKLIAHPILSFDFGPQGHLCFSIETRVAHGQGYSPIAGLYRQYELIYIAADEGDVVRLRTNFKHEDIYLYRILMPESEVHSRFLEYTRSPQSATSSPGLVQSNHRKLHHRHSCSASGGPARALGLAYVAERPW